MKIEKFQSEFLTSKNDRNSLFSVQNAQISYFGMIQPSKPNNDFCQVDLEKFDCGNFKIRWGHNTKLFVHSKGAWKCVQLNKCCLKDDEIRDKLFYDERDYERFCHGEDQPTYLHHQINAWVKISLPALIGIHLATTTKICQKVHKNSNRFQSYTIFMTFQVIETWISVNNHNFRTSWIFLEIFGSKTLIFWCLTFFVSKVGHQMDPKHLTLW